MHYCERLRIGHYYQHAERAGGHLSLAVSTGRNNVNTVWLAPYDKHKPRMPKLRIHALHLGMPGPYMHPAHLQPAEVIEGAVSERGFMMRALRHPTTDEVLVTAGCRVELGFLRFLQMLRRTQPEASRSHSLQWQLEYNLRILRLRCLDQGWKVEDLSALVE